MTYIGIDPGQKGAMAVIDGEGRLQLLIPFDEQQYIFALKALVDNTGGALVCCIEDVHSLPREGVTSAHRFGRSVGWLHGVLDALGVPYQPVTPQKWKKEFSLNADKEASIQAFHRLFPGESLKRTENSRKDDDNMAEAGLLAMYAKRHW